MKQFQIAYSDGKFWTVDQDEQGEYETEVTSWLFANSLANGYRWGLKYKTSRQRKYRINSAVTLTVEAMLPSVIHHLKGGNEVTILTPDVTLVFFNR